MLSRHPLLLLTLTSWDGFSSLNMSWELLVWIFKWMKSVKNTCELLIQTTVWDESLMSPSKSCYQLNLSASLTSVLSILILKTKSLQVSSESNEELHYNFVWNVKLYTTTFYKMWIPCQSENCKLVSLTRTAWNDIKRNKNKPNCGD